MGLTFPLNPSQAGYQVAHNNLSVLLCAKNTHEDVTSEVVRNAFKDYQDSKMGLGHYVKKYTVSLAAYGATIGIPVCTVVGATYWFFKDYITNPFQVPYDLAGALYNNKPAFDPNTPVIGGLASYTTPAFFLGTMGAVAVVDRACNDKLGVSPIKSVANWSVNMMSTAILYAAYKAGEMVGASYHQGEEEKIETRKSAHKMIIDQLKCIYDHVAEGFFGDFEKGMDSPKEMMRFKHMAEQLEENFPYIKTQLADLDLKSFEIDLIMNKLSLTVTTIKESALEFKQAGTEDSHRFNIELIKTLPKKEISSIAIPSDVKNHIKIADYNQLGAMHTLKSLVKAGAAGVAATVITDLALTALVILTGQAAGVDVTRNMQTGIAIMAAFPALNQGAKITKEVFNGFVEERVNANMRKDEQTLKAHEKLLEIYNGIAKYLVKQRNASKHNPFAMQLMSEEAMNILSKLPQLEAEIAKSSVLRNHYDITEKLRQILVTLA